LPLQNALFLFNTVSYNRGWKLGKIQDEYFGITLEDQLTFITSEIDYCKTNTTFFNNKLYFPFLSKSRELLEVIIENSKKRFECDITPQKSKIVEKRYPLNESGRVLKIAIFLTNKGPGMALNVEANVITDNDSVVIGSENMELGNIPPGNFSILIEILLIDKTDDLNIYLEIAWGKVSSADRYSLSIDTQILSQASNIDWINLSKLEPYSTEVAEGEEFVGRKEKLLSIGNRVLKTRMHSSYITGQKRVGKTSLACAVRDNISHSKSHNDVQFTYLEWGDYSHADSSRTIKELGLLLADFLKEFRGYLQSSSWPDFRPK
jgi:hypothetical protein